MCIAKISVAGLFIRGAREAGETASFPLLFPLREVPPKHS
jgi:hypothetical protein